jgi:hypothetical protein
MSTFDLRHHAEQAATCLGTGWQVAPDSDTFAAWLTHPDGRELHLSASCGPAPRIEVTVYYPPSDYHFDELDRPQISIPADRGPAVLAAEITRRLLPIYQAVLADVHAHLAKQASRKAARVEVAARLTAELPGATIADNDLSHTTLVHWHHSQNGHGDITIDPDAATVSLWLHAIPVRLATHALAVLADPPRIR